MLCCYEGQRCSRSCCFLMGTCCQETTSVCMNTFWTLCFNLLPESVVYLPHPKMKWISTHARMHEKKNLIWVFREISGGCRREYHIIAWKGRIEKVWLILLCSLKPSRTILALRPTDSWTIKLLPQLIMGLLHTTREPLLPQRSKGPSMSHLYFTSTVDRSLRFQHNVWTKIVEEILPGAGQSIISAAQAMKYRPGPTNKESYLVC